MDSVYDIRNIDLLDVLERYAKVPKASAEPQPGNRWLVTCPYHDDTNPSMVVYDKTARGEGWDFHCFACGAHGDAVSVVYRTGQAKDYESAEALLRKEFGLVVDGVPRLADFCKIKGLDCRFLELQGIENVETGIRFPYFDPNGIEVAAKIRTKYFGRSKYVYEGSAEAQLYGAHWLPAVRATADTSYVIVCEGETDTLTLRQAGLPVFGVPGSNGWKPAFAEALQGFESIVVARDNDRAGWDLVRDIAEDPRLAGTPLYITVLDKGIPDINSFHNRKAHGKTEEMRLLWDTIPRVPATPETFIADVERGVISVTEPTCWDMVRYWLTGEADALLFIERLSKVAKVSKSILSAFLVRSRITGSQLSGGLEEKEGAYFRTTMTSKGVPVETKISNFIARPIYDIDTPHGVVRVVDLLSELGKMAPRVHIAPAALTSPRDLNARLMSAGDFIFTGSQEDLFCFVEQVFSVEKPVMVQPPYIGRLEDGGWLYDGFGITVSGELVQPDDDGVVTLGDRSYVPFQMVDGAAPTIQPAEASTLPWGFAAALRRSFGTPSVWIALGWLAASYFAERFYRELGFFPILFVTGKRRSGKTTLMSLLHCAAGFPAASDGLSLETTTVFGAAQMLAYRSCLPCWFDDYRSHSPKAIQKNNLFLDAYNRHGSVKGTRDGDVRRTPVRGTAALSGESLPTDSALFTRCVAITLSEGDRISGNAHLRETSRAALEAQGFFIRLAQLEASGGWEDLKQTLSAEIKRLGAAGSRERLNKAVVSAAFRHFVAPGLPQDDLDAFDRALDGAITEQELDAELDHPVTQFLNELPSCGLTHDVNFQVSGLHIYLHLTSCFALWERLHHNNAPESKANIARCLKNEEFFAGNRVQVRLRGLGPQRCVSLDLAKLRRDPAYDDFLALVEQAKAAKATPQY